jgi:hypothetical protein
MFLQQEAQLEPAEKDFFNSLKDTLAQKGLPPPKHPKWRGHHISLLLFYTAVQQQGGFETVSPGHDQDFSFLPFSSI